MSLNYEAKIYSQGRTTVMGIATAMIIWFHCEIPMASGSIAEFCKMISDIGVDMFLLASGVGMYFALEKYPSYTAFVMGRLRRILPAYLLVSILWYGYRDLILGGRNIPSFLINVTTASFWLKGDLSCWYVAAILVIYLVTPLYGKLWKRREGLNAAVICVLYGVLTLTLLGWIPDIFGHTMIIAARLPVYFLGLWLGKAIHEDRIFRIPVLAAAIAIMLSLFIVAVALGRTALSLNWSFKYLAYGPIAVLLSLLSARIPAGKAMDYMGRYSLEIYLLFEKFQATLADQQWMWPLMDRSEWYRPLLAFAATLVCVAPLQWLGGKLWPSKRKKAGA